MAAKKTAKTTIVKATIQEAAAAPKEEVETPKKEKQTRTHVSVEDFIQAYKTGETYEEVAKMLGQSVTTIQQRVYNYKRKGINLIGKPSKGRGAKKLDIDKINKMLEE